MSDGKVTVETFRKMRLCPANMESTGNSGITVYTLYKGLLDISCFARVEYQVSYVVLEKN